ncbi:MAG: hypothetical protein R2745_03715 [Vicinamibacterales bacterium]
MSDVEGRFVFLRDGGPVVPLEAVQLALRLEAEGFRFSLDTDGWLMVAPIDEVCPADRAALRKWHRHISMVLVSQALADRRPS